MTDPTEATEPLYIRLYLHCRQCALECPDGDSPESFARLSAGLTADGRIAILCVRHHTVCGVFRLHPEIAAHFADAACEKDHDE
jgi:hypothetical protein